MANSEQEDKERDQNYFLVREEQFSALKEFSRVFAKAISAFALGDSKKVSTIRGAFWLECSFCRMQAGGEEILSISGSSDASGTSPTLKRLRAGNCGREGCESPSCRLFFSRELEREWPEIFVHVQEVQNAEKRALTKKTPKRWSLPRIKVLRLPAFKVDGMTVARVGIAVALLAVLIFVRHWRAGGEIPLLREPEKFKVAPLPPGETETPD